MRIFIVCGLLCMVALIGKAQEINHEGSDITFKMPATSNKNIILSPETVDTNKARLRIGTTPSFGGNYSYYFTHDHDYTYIGKALGIGISSPQHLLHLNATNPVLRIQSKVNNSIGGKIRFTEYFFQGAYMHYEADKNRFDIGMHHVADEELGSDVPSITVLRHNQYVGIGNISPVQRLHVNGIVRSAGYHIENGGGIVGIGNGAFSIGEGEETWSLVGKEIKIVHGVVGRSALLTVAGKVHAKEVKIDLQAGADFVFDEEYNLPELSDVEVYIKKEKHLPEIAPASEMIKSGLNSGEFQIQLLQKIEELTLYTIEQESKIKRLEKLVEQLLNDK
ncbi:hypothetical protein FUAX_52880 (plasmid) [Fulvitalea axinellae]|uniref:Uncharacterized protein n=1 Tax=Fulvitalea axinellae TaxID=1182444 RepID=A0AAU9CUX1_9BACT|nr:hypothetical protein FUAX_52880 [Fulvitalea axinellae]